jgi:hypothetical protein
MRKPLGTLAALGLGAGLWGHFEAGWVRLRSMHVAIPGLPAELEGLRIVHLSDFHLGFPSRGSSCLLAISLIRGMLSPSSPASGELPRISRAYPAFLSAMLFYYFPCLVSTFQGTNC